MESVRHRNQYSFLFLETSMFLKKERVCMFSKSTVSGRRLLPVSNLHCSISPPKFVLTTLKTPQLCTSITLRPEVKLFLSLGQSAEDNSDCSDSPNSPRTWRRRPVGWVIVTRAHSEFKASEIKFLSESTMCREVALLQTLLVLLFDKPMLAPMLRLKSVIPVRNCLADQLYDRIGPPVGQW